MPTLPCGHAYRNKLTIPGLPPFPIGEEDVQVSRGVEGSKNLQLKLGSFTDSISAIRVEYKISLYYLTRTIYDSLKIFAQNDLLQNYLNNYQGSINLNFSGETKSNCIIKSIQIGGTSAFFPISPTGEEERIERVDLILLAPNYEII